MDVDVVVRRSGPTSIATLSVAVLFGSVMAGSYEFLRQLLSAEATVLIAAVVMSAIAMLFAPMKNWVQERIDRFFYGEKYDYRVTLQDFGRALSSTTELDVLLDGWCDGSRKCFQSNAWQSYRGPKKVWGFSLARTEGHRSRSDPATRISSHSFVSKADPLVSSVPSVWTQASSERTTLRMGRHCEDIQLFRAMRGSISLVAVIGLGRGAGGALLHRRIPRCCAPFRDTLPWR